MSDNRRQLRLEKELREVIGTYLIRGFRGELQGLVSVPRVECSADLRSAQVFVSVMGTDAQRGATMESLDEHSSDVQSEVHRQLRLKFTPKLSFRLDLGLEKQLRVEGILRKLELERASRAAPQESPAEAKDKLAVISPGGVSTAASIDDEKDHKVDEGDDQ